MIGWSQGTIIIKEGHTGAKQLTSWQPGNRVKGGETPPGSTPLGTHLSHPGPSVPSTFGYDCINGSNH